MAATWAVPDVATHARSPAEQLVVRRVARRRAGLTAACEQHWSPLAVGLHGLAVGGGIRDKRC